MPRDLIIVRAGAPTLHARWLEGGTPPDWDLYVCPYQPIAAEAAPGVTLGEVVPGQKWTGLRHLLKTWRGWRDYRYVMLADDDLLADAATFNRFFARCAEQGSVLAQPGLSRDSYFFHLATLANASFAVRRTSFVEIMMPCLRSDFLADVLGTLDEGETGFGWALDYVWPKLAGYSDIHIVDETPVVHTRPVGTMRNAEVNRAATLEARRLKRRHGIRRQIVKTFGGLAVDGRRLGLDREPVSPRFADFYQGDSLLLHALVRGYADVFDRHPDRFKPFLTSQMARPAIAEFLGPKRLKAWGLA